MQDWQPQWGPGELQRRLGVTDARAGFLKDLKRALEGPTPDDRFAAAVKAQKEQELLEAYRWAQQQERARQPEQAQPGRQPTAAELIRREIAGHSAAGEVWSNTDGLANQAANALAARPQ